MTAREILSSTADLLARPEVALSDDPASIDAFAAIAVVNDRLGGDIRSEMEAMRLFEKHVGSTITAWCELPGRTNLEVIAALRKAAE